MAEYLRITEGSITDEELAMLDGGYSLTRSCTPVRGSQTAIALRVAASRDALPRLIAEVERLRERERVLTAVTEGSTP